MTATDHPTTTAFDGRRWARWLGTFIAFPIAGIAARLAAGDIDAAPAALVGGLAGGAALGAAQAWIGGLPTEDRIRWVGATAGGLAVGLLAGATAVGFATDTGSLAAMGAVSGLAVGVAQALAMGTDASRLDRVAWAVATPVLWALGWAITAQVIVDVDRHHAVFGSSGALVVCALSGLLHARRRRAVDARDAAPRATGSAFTTAAGSR